MHLADLIPILQISIGPVILISGVGLLVGSMNNRLGRTIDRSRVLIEIRNHATDSISRARQHDQLEILWRRAQILRTAITLAVFCVLLVAILIIVVFIGALLEIGNRLRRDHALRGVPRRRSSAHCCTSSAT